MDGKTIVVGGLIRNNKTVQETKVPILGDIPVIGWAFKRKSVEYKKTNLLVFITPHIVTKQEKIDSVTRQKRNTLKRLKDEE
jgi:general secretion pathway protein D